MDKVVQLTNGIYQNILELVLLMKAAGYTVYECEPGFLSVSDTDGRRFDLILDGVPGYTWVYEVRPSAAMAAQQR